MKIIRGEIPSNKVYEDDHTIAIHDIDPQAPIHILVIPKKEVPDFQNADSETIGHIHHAVLEVARLLGLDESGYRIVVNNGEDAGQEVAHLHFHILGGTRLGHVHHKDNTHKTL